MTDTNLVKAIGFDVKTKADSRPSDDLIERINLYLAALGEPIFGDMEDFPTLSISENLVSNFRARNALLKDGLRPPADMRIESFLESYLAELPEADRAVRLPGKTFNLIKHGIARALSLPPDQDSFHSDIIESYRVANGVLHNPVNDRRTTKGVFHVAEGGLPIPDDKKAVPKLTFARLLQAALRPPEDLMLLPFTSTQEKKAHVWVSLLLRPVICPAVPGSSENKSMEIRFFAPGSMTCNLDFVESIFGNAGDPYLPENDAGLDVESWSGHSGCVILAPHIKELTKKELGLPHVAEATERQKRDGMCWESEDERYNDGGAFKITARTDAGVVVTLIADNYFGYCKKEVKTQIGYAANLFGNCEEEHAGGTLAFSSYDLGEEFELSPNIDEEVRSFASIFKDYGDRMEMQPEGHAIDCLYPKVFYIPETARFSLAEQTISWEKDGSPKSIKLLADKTYIFPNGYKVQLVKPAEGRRWRLIGTVPEATNCHKPCTVSGGGKSEISKSIADAIIHAPFYVGNLKKDFDAVERILNGNYGGRFKDASLNRENTRPILGPARSLGSVIKLLTPGPEYTTEHNTFIRSIPTHIKELVLLLKRFYKPDWGENWRERFTVDIINGISGHELKYKDGKVITSYLRVGYDDNGSWRVFSLRKDFFPATKIQTEDDISASVVLPWERIPGEPGKSQGGTSAKIVRNCEYRLFQRPDDAVIRGYDKKTEEDMSGANVFFSNYQPLSRPEALEMMEDAVRFDYFTDPMKNLLRDFVTKPESNPDFVVSSSNPRIVDGKPTKNPRYLQNRTSLAQPQVSYVAEMGARFKRKLKPEDAVLYPVSGLLTGRRNNPPEGPIRSLAVFNPIHYLPLPEAFMEFTSSMTGKSPSTTGAGSEGALTKAPFNALLPITDLNNALVATALTGLDPFVTAAGYVGPNFRVDHDISLLVPEIWCRMRRFERQPEWLIEHGFLEPVPEFLVKDKSLPTGLLGYRINQAFVNYFLGRIFTSPEVLFTEAMLKPELQDLDVFADGLDNMMTTHQVVAGNYFRDGSIELACPPMKALLYIMKDGNYNGKTLKDPEVRDLFKPEVILSSDWYQERLQNKQDVDVAHWNRMLDYLKSYDQPLNSLHELQGLVSAHLKEASGKAYLKSLQGTLGRDRVIPAGS
ncbi:hypothetical protein G0Q06_11695 [Puniceicoccales bacterium CK1056]|uniref:PPi-type phosphoenolpyruvate carboxykinase lobe 2 domain-containing protein n=1 Tax=Oceanipulchritudo coccoides TaxID=2706888 RepID=A0A6B2M2E6_9BACT|nr:hypothetical protein [Oceanipulchritudo coccoides]NDV63118.1 hypothetical protein [Oceanipulchritudo coccoides]